MSIEVARQGRVGFSSARGAAGAVLLLCALVPLCTSNFTQFGFFELPFTYDQTSLPKAIVVLLVTWASLFVWSLRRFVVSGWRVPHAIVSLLLMLGILCVSAATSISPLHSVFGWYTRYEGLVTYFTYAGLYVLVVHAVPSARWRAIAWAIFGSGVLVSVYGIMQVFGVDPTDWLAKGFESTRAFATYGNPNFLGAFLVFPLGFGLALSLSESDGRMRLIAGAGTAICVLCMLATLTRGAWIGALFTFMVMLVTFARARIPFKRTAILSIASVLIIGMIAFGALSSFDPAARVSSLVRGSDAGVKGRVVIWQAGVAAFRERPLLGSGPDTFAVAAAPHMPRDATESADAAHSYPLQILVTTGILGLLGHAVFFARVLFTSGRRALRVVDSTDQRAILYSAAWATAVGYLTALGVGLSLPGTSMFLWVVLAILARPLSKSRLFVAPLGRAIVSVGLAGILVASSVLAYRAVAADNAFIHARAAKRGGGEYKGKAYPDLVREAARLNPASERYQLELSTVEFMERLAD